MKFKGRDVIYVRDAFRNDPLFDPGYPQVIVQDRQGNQETAKLSELTEWDENVKNYAKRQLPEEPVGEPKGPAPVLGQVQAVRPDVEQEKADKAEARKQANVNQANKPIVKKV